MEEQEFIDKEQAKMEEKLVALLHKVQRTGQASKQDSELLLVNDLACVGGPRDGIRYNCLHLTEKGKNRIVG